MEVTEEVMTIEIITITIIIEMTAEITRIKIEDKITMRIETPEMIAEMIEEEIIIILSGVINLDLDMREVQDILTQLKQDTIVEVILTMR